MIENNVQCYLTYMQGIHKRTLLELAINRFKWELSDNLKGISTRYLEKSLVENGIAGICYDSNLQTYLSLNITPKNYNIYQEPIEVYGYGYNYNRNFNISEFEYIYNNRMKSSSLVDINKYAEILSNVDTTLFFLAKKMKQPYIISTTSDNKLNDRIIRNQLETYDTLYIDDTININDKINVLTLPISNANINDLITYKNSVRSEILTILGINNVEFEKRERLLSDEVNANEHKISRYLQSAYTERLEFCERFNKKFNENINVIINNDIDLTI